MLKRHEQIPCRHTGRRNVAALDDIHEITVRYGPQRIRVRVNSETKVGEGEEFAPAGSSRAHVGHVEERALASDEKCECVSAECGCQRVSGGRLPPQVQSRERSPVVRDARSPESRPENRPPRGAYAPPPYGVGVRAERGKNPVKKRACIYKNTFIET